jgi:hypothetical protein
MWGKHDFIQGVHGMKKLLSIGIAALMLTVGAIVICPAQSQETALGKVPDPVMKIFKSTFPAGKIFKVDVENGVTVYDLEFKEGPVEKETDITADGTMLEYTVVVDAKDLPAAAIKTIRKTAEGATMKRIEHIEISYETKDGKAVKLSITIGITISPDGKIQEEESPTEKAAETDGKSAFADVFNVDKANLANVDVNPYFILVPGYRLHFAGGGATLTVSVLNETKLVDGVVTARRILLFLLVI